MRYIINNKVKTKWSKLIQLCLLAAIPAFFGCADDGNGYFLGDTVPMTLYLQTSNAHQTRAYIGDLAAESEAESKINTIKVWFVDPDASGSAPVAFAGTISDNKVTVTLPRTLVSKGTADVYIIANAESAGLGESLTKNSTVAEITAATIAVDNFGTATPVTAVPETGLPMSRIVKGLALTEGGEPKTNLGDISLTRAVSKIRFAFGMYTGDLGEIVGISLDGNQIAGAEYIMPVDPATNTADYTAPYQGDLKANITAGSYQSAELLLGSKTEGTLVANTAIHTTQTTDNPSNYTWDNWTAANASVADKATTYNTAITPFVTHTVYLRETDKQLTGKIYYRLSSTAGVQEAPFSMVANETPVQDFARNHVWIVYSYFEGGKLYVKPTVAPWKDADELIYTLKMSTNMRLFDSWLYRYDTVDQDYTNWSNWAGSHMVVSDGRVTSPVAPEVVPGRPLYSPQIQLVTTGVAGSSFDLVIDNADFEIVRANKNDVGVVTSYDASTDGKLTIAAGEDVYTYFYIVPKAANPANVVAKVSLIYNDPVLGPQKVTFNYSALPGYSDDSAEIWAYYFPNDQYNITDKLKMYYQDANHPLVPTAVQN